VIYCRNSLGELKTHIQQEGLYAAAQAKYERAELATQNASVWLLFTSIEVTDPP